MLSVNALLPAPIPEESRTNLTESQFACLRGEGGRKGKRREFSFSFSFSRKCGSKKK